jgi:hypothetical protein
MARRPRAAPTTCTVYVSRQPRTMHASDERIRSRPAGQVHDQLNDTTLVWRTAWAHRWQVLAKPNKVDGTVSFDGLILDGWEPLSPRG